MSEDFIKKIENFIDENSLLSGGERIVLGASGGADSTALLLVLDALKAKYDLSLFVAHVNHGLRKEAGSEADYVKSLCDKRNIPFHLKEVDLNVLSKEMGMGTEEAGRKIRYAFFEEVLEKEKGDLIAVAHNKNDCAETMLFNLVRGTGLKGLASIEAKRDKIIRPLLCVERWEIEEYLNDVSVRFCVDASNLTDDYSRNRIRNNIIPKMKESINDQAVSHMATTAYMLSKLNGYVERVVDDSFSEVASVRKKTVVFLRDKFLETDEYIQGMLIKKAIDVLVPNNKDITHRHVYQVLELFNKEGSKQCNLPYGIKAVSGYEFVYVTLDEKEDIFDADFVKRTEPLALEPGESCFLDSACRVETQIISYLKDIDLSQNQYTKYFDYDKIDGRLALRNRETGDEIVVNRSGGKKKIKDYMIDEKIPATMRDDVLLIAKGHDVIWVIGHRISEAYKVTDNTERVLKVSILKED